MRWPRWLRPRRNGSAAAALAARVDAERKLRAARADWPDVQRAHDILAGWVDTALRGGR